MTSLASRSHVVGAAADVGACLVANGDGVEPFEACATVLFMRDHDALDRPVGVHQRARQTAAECALVAADIVVSIKRACGIWWRVGIQTEQRVLKRAAVAAALSVFEEVRAVPMRQIARLALIGA